MMRPWACLSRPKRPSADQRGAWACDSFWIAIAATFPPMAKFPGSQGSTPKQLVVGHRGDWIRPKNWIIACASEFDMVLGTGDMK